jgi:hypothetical protein
MRSSQSAALLDQLHQDEQARLAVLNERRRAIGLEPVDWEAQDPATKPPKAATKQPPTPSDWADVQELMTQLTARLAKLTSEGGTVIVGTAHVPGQAPEEQAAHGAQVSAGVSRDH